MANLTPRMLRALRSLERIERQDQRGVTRSVIPAHTAQALLRRGLVAENPAANELCLTPQGRALVTPDCENVVSLAARRATRETPL